MAVIDHRYDSPADRGATPRPLDWRKKMSNAVAWALLVYTALQIFVTMNALHAQGTSMLPYFALIMLVIAIIPACRRFDRRWGRLSNEEAADPSQAPRFRRDMITLWLLAIGLPFVVTALFKLLALTFGR